MGRKKTDNNDNQLLGIVAVIVIGIFVIGVIIIFAKSLFSGIDKDVPKGIDTGTIAGAGSISKIASEQESQKSPESSETGKKAETSAETTTTTAEPTTKTVLEYAYLLDKPAEDGEHIICMSPGIEVTLLSAEDENGYVKATFNNMGTQLTGYVHSSYIA